MQKLFLPTLLLLLPFALSAADSVKTIHVIVALCDNANQGIVKVPQKLGNGQDPHNNLYWGAMYGVKNYLRYKTTDWVFVKKLEQENQKILERVLFKHAAKEVYLLADAYDGAEIKTAIEDLLHAGNGQKKFIIRHEGKTLGFGGNANLLAYIGHNGLMEFNADVSTITTTEKKDMIILACYSKSYFTAYANRCKINPLLWTTNLMAPEAYTLKAAIDGWLQNESGQQIHERAAQAYNKYQKCGINGARRLFASGF